MTSRENLTLCLHQAGQCSVAWLYFIAVDLTEEGKDPLSARRTEMVLK